MINLKSDLLIHVVKILNILNQFIEVWSKDTCGMLKLKIEWFVDDKSVLHLFKLFNNLLKLIFV